MSYFPTLPSNSNKQNPPNYYPNQPVTPQTSPTAAPSHVGTSQPYVPTQSPAQMLPPLNTPSQHVASDMIFVATPQGLMQMPLQQYQQLVANGQLQHQEIQQAESPGRQALTHTLSAPDVLQTDSAGADQKPPRRGIPGRAINAALHPWSTTKKIMRHDMVYKTAFAGSEVLGAVMGVNPMKDYATVTNARINSAKHKKANVQPDQHTQGTGHAPHALASQQTQSLPQAHAQVYSPSLAQPYPAAAHHQLPHLTQPFSYPVAQSQIPQRPYPIPVQQHLAANPINASPSPPFGFQSLPTAYSSYNIPIHPMAMPSSNNSYLGTAIPPSPSTQQNAGVYHNNSPSPYATVTAAPIQNVTAAHSPVYTSPPQTPPMYVSAQHVTSPMSPTMSNGVPSIIQPQNTASGQSFGLSAALHAGKEAPPSPNPSYAPRSPSYGAVPPPLASVSPMEGSPVRRRPLPSTPLNLSPGSAEARDTPSMSAHEANIAVNTPPDNGRNLADTPLEHAMNTLSVDPSRAPLAPMPQTQIRSEADRPGSSGTVPSPAVRGVPFNNQFQSQAPPGNDSSHMSPLQSQNNISAPVPQQPVNRAKIGTAMTGVASALGIGSMLENVHAMHQRDQIAESATSNASDQNTAQATSTEASDQTADITNSSSPQTMGAASVTSSDQYSCLTAQSAVQSYDPTAQSYSSTAQSYDNYYQQPNAYPQYSDQSQSQSIYAVDPSAYANQYSSGQYNDQTTIPGLGSGTDSYDSAAQYNTVDDSTNQAQDQQQSNVDPSATMQEMDAFYAPLDACATMDCTM